MNKYDFTLDMDSDNSNSIILRNILPNSIVLEFGAAYGRMTKYLKEKLNCQVYIVEKDLSSGTHAAQFAKDYTIGESAGDINKNYWYHKFKNIKFDYIIFADVLEHLIDPFMPLVNCKELLSPTGSILISIPNISHNSVLIDLLNDKFTYRDIGILDDTHIKFFTPHSLKYFIQSAGLYIENKFDAKNFVENTEFNNSYEDVPKEVADFLKTRESGDIYQMIWQLKPQTTII